MTLKEEAMEFDGTEVHKERWNEAEKLVKTEPELFSLGPARGPGREWRRLSYHGE